jgi:hypothetical protein
VAFVESLGIRSQKPFHPENEVRLRRFKNQMEMITHQTVCMYLPFGFAASLAQSRQKPLAVSVILKDILAPITAIHDVVDRSRVLQSQLAGHRKPLAAQTESVNSEG